MSASGTEQPLATSRDLTGLITRVFAAWQDADLPFLVLRNYEQLPESVSNDIDVLVDRQHLRRAEELLVEAARSAGYALHNRAAFGPLSLFLHQPESRQQVQVDLFTRLEWRGLMVLRTTEVLGRRVARDGFAVPHPIDEAALNLLTRLLYNGYVKEKYRDGTRMTFQAEPDAAMAALTDPFGFAQAQFLTQSVLAKEWSEIEARAGSLRRTLLRRRLRHQPMDVLQSVLRDAQRLIRRWFSPPGLALVLLGPDGCGKSTVAPKVIDALRHTFSPDKGFQIHWKPIVFFRKRRKARPPTTNPHGRPPRGRLASLLFLAYHWMEYFLGSLTQIHRVKFRNGLVMIDRHYYDFVVDAYRYRLKVPAWTVRLGGYLLPKPDLVFLLDAPAEVLQSRKHEVPLAETERQRQAFLELVNKLPNGHVMDATQSPDKVASDIVAEVLKHLTERTRRRH